MLGFAVDMLPLCDMSSGMNLLGVQGITPANPGKGGGMPTYLGGGNLLNLLTGLTANYVWLPAKSKLTSVTWLPGLICIYHFYC